MPWGGARCRTADLVRSRTADAPARRMTTFALDRVCCVWSIAPRCPTAHGDGSAAIRTIFAQPQADTVRDPLDVIPAIFCQQLPRVETMLREAADFSFDGLLISCW